MEELDLPAALIDNEELLQMVPRVYQNEMLQLAEKENIIVLADTVDRPLAIHRHGTDR